ncbi:hypothetical protein DL96DRAFT_1643014 [Flagelloscypha sp. PMI_526]|nr:hypothetical protein DL96DRAFT_1643014 [Flagelloscypha sp. PMI_526]
MLLVSCRDHQHTVLALCFTPPSLPILLQVVPVPYTCLEALLRFPICPHTPSCSSEELVRFPMLLIFLSLFLFLPAVPKSKVLHKACSMSAIVFFSSTDVLLCEPSKLDLSLLEVLLPYWLI